MAKLDQIVRMRRTLEHYGVKQVTGTIGESGIYLTLARDVQNRDAVIGLTYFKLLITKTEWGTVKSKRMAASKPSIGLTMQQAKTLLNELKVVIDTAETEHRLV